MGKERGGKRKRKGGKGKDEGREITGRRRR